MSYPNPCDTCEIKDCTKGCVKWTIRYRYRQKQINAYATNLLRPKVKTRKTTNFVYAHPDEIRRLCNSNPCEGCKLEENCDRPCDIYLHWYDTRMAVVRAKAKL